MSVIAAIFSSLLTVRCLLPAAIGNPFIPNGPELWPFVSDLWLIVTLVAVLLTPFFSRRSNLSCAVVALAGLAMALLSLLFASFGDEGTASYFRGLLIADPFAVLWKAMLLVFVIGIVLMWLSTTAETLHLGDGPEFFVLLIGATLGMSLMASTTNLLMIFMVVELASLPSYVLAGFRKTHRVGAEASLKYVLFGAASSAIMVYGLSMLYGLYGTLQIDGSTGLAEKMASGATGNPALLAVAVFGLIAGIGFKISAAPFHLWVPDVFEGTTIDVAAFLSVASKGAGLVLLLRVLMVVADALGYRDAPHVSLTAIAAVIGVLGAMTATVGNTAALVQSNIKRLLAYSSIAHAGYMLCALSLLVNHRMLVTDNLVNSPAAALLLYLIVYLFMNLGAFTVAGLVFRETGSEDLSAFAGLGRRSPLLAACMTCCLLSLIGLPPFGGFVAKVYLMWVLIQNGSWWWALVAVIAINTIVSLYFYARVLKAMFLKPSAEPAFGVSPIGTAVTLGSAVMLLILFLGFGPLSTLAQRYARLHAVDGVGVSRSAPIQPRAPVVSAAR